MDPFHVVRLAGDALDRCRRRVQQRTRGHRGRAKDPLYRARRTLHTGADLLTDNQNDRLTRLFDTDIHGDGHVEVEATWGVYQPAPTRRRLEGGVTGYGATAEFDNRHQNHAGHIRHTPGTTCPHINTQVARRCQLVEATVLARRAS